ncbi:MAG: 30S ribosomal protein S15 [Flavobacteriales bacterium]
MYLTAEIKRNIFSKYGKSEADTGIAKGQVALFTFRINHLSQHLKIHKKDFNTELALIKLVGKRKKLLKYVEKNNVNSYRETIKELGIRK